MVIITQQKYISDTSQEISGRMYWQCLYISYILIFAVLILLGGNWVVYQVTAVFSRYFVEIL